MKKRKTAFFMSLLLGAFIACPEPALAEPYPVEEAVADITWSRTSEPYGYAVLPVAGWSWSDVEDINHDRTHDVWDGGGIGSFYIGDAKRSWDIATWHTTRPYWNGTCDVRRFHGEFTIPEGYSVYDDVTLSSAGDYSPLGLDGIIAINDDIYVFIYPKGQEINDGNFLDYFAFWTGTAGQEKAREVNNGELITFHGIQGTTPRDYKEVLGIADTGTPIPPENLLSHTDGWYCEAFENNVGRIMQKSPGAAEFVIDLFVEDFAEDGGMDRMNLTFSRTAEVLPPEASPSVPPVTEPPEILPPEAEAPVTEPPEESPKTYDTDLLPYSLFLMFSGTGMLCLLSGRFKR